MAEDRVRKSIVLSIYGVGGVGLPSTFVDAEVFSAKLNAFLRALKAADRIAGKSKAEKHTYYISHMRTGSAVVGITELAQLESYSSGSSSLDTFIRVASAVETGDFAAIGQYGPLANSILNIAKGANRSYSRMDLKPSDDPNAKSLVQIDEKFEYQAEQFVARTKLPIPAKEEPPAPYIGSAYDAFDGTIKEVDLRDAVWSGKLVLTGSKVELHCTFKDMALDDVRKNLDTRVWAEGLAVYTGKSGLPHRLEVKRMRPINTAGDLRRWRGKLLPNEAEGDDESDRLEH